MKTIGGLLFVLLISSISFAQRNVKDSTIGTPWLTVQYGFNFCGGDLADRYGHFNHIGFFAGYKTKKNWVFGGESHYMFGNDIRLTGLFDHLVDSYGNITDENGDIAKVLVFSRGVHANGIIGKVLPIFSPNKNSGIYINLGVGYLLHKLRIETNDQVIPELELDYRRGYDRLTTGLNTSQFLGYAFMANHSFVNFVAGFYIQEGFTYNRRTLNYDSPETPVSTDMRLDLQYGIKVGWMIPIYKRQPKEFYYN